MLKPVESSPAFGVKVELSRTVEDQILDLTQQLANLTAAMGEFMQRPPYTIVQPQSHVAMRHTFIRDENGRVTGAIVEPCE